MSILRHHLFHAFKWSAAGEFASRFIQPLVFLALARLLTPEDFGVMAAAMMVISFSQIFWEAGMGKALIQRKQDIEAAANAAFWINAALAAIVATLIFAASKPVATHVFRDERVALVLQVMVVHVLLGALAAIPTALLQKTFRFKRLFWVRLLAAIVPACASIPLAIHGFSYWALVVGVLVGQAVQAIVLWKAQEWRPKRGFDIRVAREMCGFAAWVGLSGLLGWFYVWADALVVGMYLGSRDLGLYRTGNLFVTMLFGIIFAPLLPVMYSHLSAIQDNRQRLKTTYVHVITGSMVIAIPMAFILFAISEQIEALIFGQAWAGIGFVIGIMALTHGIAWVVGANGEVYRAIGRPVLETIFTAAPLPIYLAGYIWSISRGFEDFVWMRFALAVGTALMSLWVIYRVLDLDIVPILRSLAKVIAISSIVVLFGLFVPLHLENISWQIATILFMSMGVVGGLLCLIDEGRVVWNLIFGHRTKGNL